MELGVEGPSPWPDFSEDGDGDYGFRQGIWRRWCDLGLGFVVRATRMSREAFYRRRGVGHEHRGGGPGAARSSCGESPTRVREVGDDR